MKHITTLITATLLGLALLAAPAAAHELEVHPPGQEESHDFGAISQSWAQAHCHAAAPTQATVSSGGVVEFSPAGPAPCGEVENPGGQVHP